MISSSNLFCVKISLFNHELKHLAHCFHPFVTLSLHAPQSSNPRAQQHLPSTGCLQDHFAVLLVYFWLEAPHHLDFLTLTKFVPSPSQLLHLTNVEHNNPSHQNLVRFVLSTKTTSIGLLSSEFSLIFLKTRSIQ